MLQGSLIIVAVNALTLFLLRGSRGVRWSSGTGIGHIITDLIAITAALTSVIAVAQTAFKGITFEEDLPLFMAVYVLSTLPVVVACANKMMDTSITAGIGGMFGLNSGGNGVNSDLSGARELDRQNNVMAANRAYWNYFEREPNNPAPLFAAAAMFQRHNMHTEGEGTLRTIMRRFEDDQAVWAEAAYQLANVLENARSDKEDIRSLLMAVRQRHPMSEVSQLAAERMRAG